MNVYLAEDQSAEASKTESGAQTALGSVRFAPLFLALILLGGFALRFSALRWGQAYSYFGQGDSVEAYQVAVNFRHGEPRAQYLGQPNYNLHSKLPGPLWTIFCFISYRWAGSVEGIAFAIVLLNTAAIFLVYVLAKQTFGERLALAAALLITTSPWAIYYSATVYNPNVMAFLGACVFLALWKSTQFDSSAAIFWVPVILLALPQFHMSGLLMTPAAAVVLALSPRKINWLWLGLGLIAAVCLYIPYFRGDMGHGWQNTRAMFGSEGGSKGYSFESFKAITAPLSFLVNWGPRWFRSMTEYREFGRASFGSFSVLVFFNVVSIALALLLILGAILEIVDRMRGFFRAPRAVFASSPGASFVTVFLLTTLLLATVGGKPFHTRYCLVLLPVLFSLAGLGAMHWLKRRDRLRHLFLVLLVVTTCANLWLVPCMHRFEGNQIEESRILVPSFRQLERIYRALKLHAGTNSFVEVDTSTYLAALRPEQKQQRDVVLVKRYIATREKDSGTLTAERPRHVYEVRSADSVPDDGQRIAYKGHGIALVERPALALLDAKETRPL